MKFNGWQRLWVVLVVLWAFPVIIVGYALWPTAADISSADADPFELLSPDATHDLDRFAKWALPAVGSEVMEPPVVDVEGHVLRFQTGVKQEGVDRTASAYSAALHRILNVRRTTFVGEVVLSWACPAVALYALGWAFAWVRRGFIKPV